MVVNFEFLGSEPIENVITCMNFKVDKVVFFGYNEVILEQREKAENFLRKYCGVQSIVFHPLSHNDLQSVLKTMRKEIGYENSRGAKICFDITGGESLILVAFGMLSKEFDTPMHLYDIPNGKLIELEGSARKSISDYVEKQNIKMSLDRLIEMRGGKINYNLRKEIKDSPSAEFEEDVDRIWQVVKTYPDLWNPFSEFMRTHLVPNGNMQVNRRAGKVVQVLSESSNKLNNVKKLNQIIDALGEAGILQEIVHTDGKYQFKFKNEDIKNCLWEGGSILELHTYQQEINCSDECQVGVHLDWDGIVHNQPGVDVLNEIDLLSLKGYVPTFISCKSGKMSSQQTLHALYELDAVAKRFGGKYAKKFLVTTKEISKVYLERAAEMGITIR